MRIAISHLSYPALGGVKLGARLQAEQQSEGLNLTAITPCPTRTNRQIRANMISPASDASSLSTILSPISSPRLPNPGRGGVINYLW